MKSSSDVRQSFIEYFRNRGHEVVSSSPVVPENDPTLLFINAGMNQFKDVFLGTGTRPYTRAVDSQICIRVSGKHNDLEDVGKDTTHLTSFEMLGNWSFGDYYKKEAIVWAWDYLTSVLLIPKERLYVTVFEEDDEARQLWVSETDISPARIVSCGKKDNFWEMGEVGPCGPCSEIHFDLRPNDPTNPLDEQLTEVDLSSGRFIELWNLVFIQYNRVESGELELLPAKHVDTGAGLERLVSVLQGTLSNYQTDIFQPIIRKIEQITGVAYTDDMMGMPHRVLADHVRTLIFGIADNVLPSNEGRGYVLRRLLRRALRYSKKLHVTTPILYKLVEDVVSVLGNHFEHIRLRQSYIETVIKAEEESFLLTLEQGLLLFEKISSELHDEKQTVVPGVTAFKLYDTFGFPVDLTQVLAQERGMTVDLGGFNDALNQQKELSRRITKEKQREARLQKTNSDAPVGVVKEEELALLVQSEYTDNIARGGEACVLVDSGERIKMARHHTGTHLIQEALRRVLGTHVYQAGSLVDTDRLRFDFTHFQSLTADQLTQVEKMCNDVIDENIKVDSHHKTLDEAKALGAMALFGEKYDENDVRVIQIGDFSTELCGGTHVRETGLIESIKIISESAVAAGTRRIEAIAGHQLIADYDRALKTKLIAQLDVKRARLESLVAHLESVCELTYYESLPSVDNEKPYDELQELLSVLDQQIRQVEKNIEKENSKKASEEVVTLIESGVILNDVLVIKHKFQGFDLKMLHTLSDQVVNSQKNALIILASDIDNKGVFLVKRGKEVSDYSARNIITSLTSIAGGGGGGNDVKAQAGGADSSKLQMALDQVDLL